MFKILKQLAAGVFLVAPETKPKYPYANCMYIDDDIPTVIDLGAGGRAFQAIAGPNVQILFISHFHFDHLHGDSFFPAAKLYAGVEESPIYNDKQAYLHFHGYDLWDTLMPGIKRQGYATVIPMPEDVPVNPGFRNIPLEKTFQDGDQFTLGKYIVQAVHLPGHTVGHYGFYLEKEGILFSGDIDLVASGPWYSSFTADVGDLIASVEKIKLINPRIIVPSHRHIQTENIFKNLAQYIQVVLDRQDTIFELLKNPMSIDTLASYRMVFPRQGNVYELFWEKMTILNHLNHLLREGLIEKIDGEFYQQL